MPGEDGYVFMERLTRSSAPQAPRVRVALSAFAAPARPRAALAAGFQRHVAKPVDPHALVRLLEEMLERQSEIASRSGIGVAAAECRSGH